MMHILKRIRHGDRAAETLQPTCSCAWIGKAISVLIDHQASLVTEQEGRHLYDVEKKEEIEGNL